MWHARYVYLFMLPGLLVLTIFRYGSIAGVQLAFRIIRGESWNLGQSLVWIG